MKHSKRLLCSVLCYAVTAIMPLSVFAENTDTEGDASTLSSSEIYAEQLLDDPLSPGIRVIAYESPMILSGTGDGNIQFSAEVFDDYNGYVPSTVKLISLPDSDSGTLIYNSEPVSSGKSISVLSLSSLYYVPSSTEDAEFTFSPDNTNIMRCIIRQRDTENTPPAVTENSAVTTYTKLNTAVAGYLGGSDPDGDAIRFEIVSRPTKGIVSVNDEQSGQFIYHPYEKMTGKDSFTYRIQDSYGAYSEIGTVTLSIDNSKANVYDDTSDSLYTSAVNDAVACGIMQTRKTADTEFFDPDEPVSRIDFLIMAMKAMGAGEAEPVLSTAFSDDTTLTDTEKGYLAAAHNLGIISGSHNNGSLTFMPDEAVTGADAAVILNGILGLPESDASLTSAMSDTVPSWAVEAFAALTEAGILNKHIAPANSVLTRENVAVILSGLMRELS